MGLIKVIRKLKDPSSCGDKRSHDWPKVRKEFLSEHPKCAVCGSDKKVEVHHCIPFNTNPELELDKNNLIALCEANKWMNCHLGIGHCGSYREYNPDVKEDAKRISEMLKTSKKNEPSGKENQ